MTSKGALLRKQRGSLFLYGFECISLGKGLVLRVLPPVLRLDNDSLIGGQVPGALNKFFVHRHSQADSPMGGIRREVVSTIIYWW